MPDILGLMGGFINLIIIVPIIIVLLILGMFLFRRFYRVASANEALVISGGRRAKPQVIIAGGKFVSPFKKCVTFPLNVMTIRSDEQETQSNSMVPIIVQWTAQLRADTTNEETLEQAVIGFLGASENDIRDSLKQTLDGEVRAVLGLMTPEDVVRNKADLSTKVSDNVNDRMKELGFILISLNIAEVTDRNNHYYNLGAQEREGRRREAENITAEAELSIAETKAATGKAANFAELRKVEDVAERQRDVDLKRAGYKAEVDQAQTDATYAGQVREQERLADLATRQGAVAVEREKQNRAAAEARREVVTTEAQTARQKLTIETEATKDKSEIEATAAASIARTRAAGDAEAAREKARGEADAVKTKAEADAEQIRRTGQANADAEEALGRARAAATLAEGQARAEAERLMAEALAANDAVNLQVTLAEIESKTRIEVSTAIATAVAEVGTNTTIIDLGSGGAVGDGDLLTRFLGNLPETLKRLDIKNQALNGKSLAGSVNEISSALLNKESVLEVSPEATQSISGEKIGGLAAIAAAASQAAAGGKAASSEVVSSDEASSDKAEPHVSGAADATDIPTAATDKKSSAKSTGQKTSQQATSDENVAADADADNSNASSGKASNSGTGSTDTTGDQAGIAEVDSSTSSYTTDAITSTEGAITATAATGAVTAVAEYSESATTATAVASGYPAESVNIQYIEAQPIATSAPSIVAVDESTTGAWPEPNAASLVAVDAEASNSEQTLAGVEASNVLADALNSLNLNTVEYGEVAQIVSLLNQDGKLSENEIYDLADFSVYTIRQYRENGQKVDPRNIVRQLLDTDGNGRTSLRELLNAARKYRQARQARRNR